MTTTKQRTTTSEAVKRRQAIQQADTARAAEAAKLAALNTPAPTLTGEFLEIGWGMDMNGWDPIPTRKQGERTCLRCCLIQPAHLVDRESRICDDCAEDERPLTAIDRQVRRATDEAYAAEAKRMRGGE